MGIKRRLVCSLSVAVAAGMALFGSSAAEAAAPTITTTEYNQTIIDTQTCSFTNTQVFTGTVRTTTLANGTVRQHFTLVGAISANGHTVYDTDHYSVTTTSDGAATYVGIFIHIVVPGTGLVMIDAGKVAISPTGDITFSGRQDQLTGNTGALCDALT